MELDVDAIFSRKATTVLRIGSLANTKRSKEVISDLPKPQTHYLFPEHGLEVRCDEADQVEVVFLASPSRTVATVSGIELHLGMSRTQVMALLGAASASGPRVNDAILGQYGEWDQFVMPTCRVHVEYELDGNGLRRITFSRKAAERH